MFNLRTKIEIFLLLILGTSIFLAHTYYNKYLEQKEQKQNIELLFSNKEKELQVYKNKQGQTVSKNETVQLNDGSIKDLVKQGNLQFLKEFDNLKKNYRNLETAFKIQTKSIDSLRVMMIDTSEVYVDKKGDSIKFIAHNFNYQDKWSDFQLKQYSPDSAEFKYQVYVPLDGVMYWKRNWFLGKKHYFTEVTSENPHIKINKLLSVKITGKKK